MIARTKKPNRKLQAWIDARAVRHLAGEYRTGDVAGHDLVFVASDDPALNATVAAEARALVDPLTGLPGEQQLMRLIKEETSRGRRTQSPLAVALLRVSGPAFPTGQHGEQTLLETIGRALRRECRNRGALRTGQADDRLLVGRRSTAP